MTIYNIFEKKILEQNERRILKIQTKDFKISPSLCHETVQIFNLIKKMSEY